MGGSLNVYGQPKAGKSRLVVQMAGAISNPSEDLFLKWPIHSHGPVWYFQLDTARNLFQTDYLSKFITAGKNLNGIAVADKEMEEVPFPFNVINPECRAFLRQAIRQANPRPIAFVIDTIRRAHNGDENDSTVMSNVLNLLEDSLRITEDGFVYMPALVIISHERKTQEGTIVDLMQANRGSNAIAGAMDCVMRVSDGEIRVDGRAIREQTVKATMVESSGVWVLDEKAAKSADTDFRVLTVLKALQPATFTQWKRACEQNGIPEGTFKDARTRLKAEGRVNEHNDLYFC